MGETMKKLYFAGFAALFLMLSNIANAATIGFTEGTRDLVAGTTAILLRTLARTQLWLLILAWSGQTFWRSMAVS